MPAGVPIECYTESTTRDEKSSFSVSATDKTPTADTDPHTLIVCRDAPSDSKTVEGPVSVYIGIHGVEHQEREGRSAGLRTRGVEI